jgi:hypothetical protein
MIHGQKNVKLIPKCTPTVGISKRLFETFIKVEFNWQINNQQN